MKERHAFCEKHVNREDYSTVTAVSETTKKRQNGYSAQRRKEDNSKRKNINIGPDRWEGDNSPAKQEVKEAPPSETLGEQIASMYTEYLLSSGSIQNMSWSWQNFNHVTFVILRIL